MPKNWKHSFEQTSPVETRTSLQESKIFGAELSGNAPSIDLHGLDTQSGTHEIDLFLHASFAHGDEVVKIIHGRGTGKMRDAVHAFLAKQTIVETFRDAMNPSEVSGVTYVVLKKAS